jgi:acetoin utilization deacetylase AcuC-like enzyme
MSPPLVYHPDYVTPLPKGHRFPMAKFGLLHDLLLADGVVIPKHVYQPSLPSPDWIELVHTAEYVRSYRDGSIDPKAMRRIGLPWSKELVNRTEIALGGTILAARLALEYGLAGNAAGGTHHAFPGYGSGFCIFNDLAIATKVLMSEGLVRRVLIVDLDVHQGDGTAVIFQQEPNVFTFSMHCGVNFPGTKQQSDLDVPLAEGMEDGEYLQTLDRYLPDLLRDFQPDLVVYDAGVDPHSGDLLGKLALTDRGLFCRDMQVLSTCAKGRYPVVYTIGGGYAADLRSLVDRHSLVFRAAAEVHRQYRL